MPASHLTSEEASVCYAINLHMQSAKTVDIATYTDILQLDMEYPITCMFVMVKYLPFILKYIIYIAQSGVLEDCPLCSLVGRPDPLPVVALVIWSGQSCPVFMCCCQDLGSTNQIAAVG